MNTPKQRKGAKNWDEIIDRDFVKEAMKDYKKPIKRIIMVTVEKIKKNGEEVIVLDLSE